jgi:hypothetical protein
VLLERAQAGAGVPMGISDLVTASVKRGRRLPVYRWVRAEEPFHLLKVTDSEQQKYINLTFST